MTADRGARARAIAGFLVAGAALLGASFLASSRAETSSDEVPALMLLAPASGDTVSNPLDLEFSTPGALRLDPAMGWSAGALHLHAMIDGVEVMPAAADITPGDSTFAWRLPALEPGSYRIHLAWAGRHHGNLRGRTDTVAVHVRD